MRIMAASLLLMVGLIVAILLTSPLINHGTNSFTTSGTLMNGVEAGCVILHSDSGVEYLLLDGSDYPPAGTRVIVKGFLDNGAASYCMQGEAAIHVVSIAVLQLTNSFSFTYGTATASTATVISASAQTSTTVTGEPTTILGYVYVVVESPRCYPQCGAPSFLLAYLYVPPGTGCSGSMGCYPAPEYLQLLQSDGGHFWPNMLNGTYVKVTGILVTPSSWNCASFYLPKICFSGDLYVANITRG